MLLNAYLFLMQAALCTAVGVRVCNWGHGGSGRGRCRWGEVKRSRAEQEARGGQRAEVMLDGRRWKRWRSGIVEAGRGSLAWLAQTRRLMLKFILLPQFSCDLCVQGAAELSKLWSTGPLMILPVEIKNKLEWILQSISFKVKNKSRSSWPSVSNAFKLKLTRF